jgi:hypothetical protein
MMTSQRGPVMLGYLPPFYGSSKAMQALLDAEGAEFDLLRQALGEVLEQMFARRATWALSDLEAELGLPPAPSLTVQERQDRVVSKSRGSGTCTLYLVKQVAESYQFGDVEVIEDHAGFTVHISFVNRTGIPSNLPDLQAGIRAVLPAHLALSYLYNWFTFAELDAKGWTWTALNSQGLTWDALAVYA